MGDGAIRAESLTLGLMNILLDGTFTDTVQRDCIPVKIASNQPNDRRSDKSVILGIVLVFHKGINQLTQQH